MKNPPLTLLLIGVLFASCSRGPNAAKVQQSFLDALPKTVPQDEIGLNLYTANENFEDNAKTLKNAEDKQETMQMAAADAWEGIFMDRLGHPEISTAASLRPGFLAIPRIMDDKIILQFVPAEVAAKIHYRCAYDPSF
jgi:hypothetical protein